MAKSQRTAVVLVAAGRGLRAGAGGPKQYREIGGVPVIYRAMEAFSRHADVFAVQPVVNPDDSAMFTAAVAGLKHEAPTNGGATRQASVLAGLEALAKHKPDIVLIHDAARPFVSAGVISRAIEAASRTGAAIPVVPVTDTIKVTERGRQCRGHAGPGALANRADAAILSFRRHPRSASSRGKGRTKRFHR